MVRLERAWWEKIKGPKDQKIFIQVDSTVLGTLISKVKGTMGTQWWGRGRKQQEACLDTFNNGESHGQRSLVGHSPIKAQQVRHDRTHTHFHIKA